MKKMTRTLLCLLLICLLTLQGCTFRIGILTGTTEGTESGTESSTADGTNVGTTTEPEDDGGYDPEKYRVSHPEQTFTYTDADGTRIETEIKALEEMVKKAEVTDAAFMEAYEKTEKDCYSLQENYYFAYIQYYLFLNDSEKEATYRKMVDVYTDLIQPFIALYRQIYESRYKEVFYKDFTEDEIKEVLREADRYSEEVAGLQAEAQQAGADQKALSEADYDSGSEQIYLKLIQTNNKIATLGGYKDYMPYAYECVYGRDYSPDEVADVNAMIQSGIFSEIDRILEGLSGTNLSFSEQMLLNQAMTGTFEDEWNRKLIDGYYKRLGGDIYEAYLDFWENGYYYIAYDENASEAGAFTFYYGGLGVPAIYFGPGYQSMFTFVHEFGHYYSMKIHEGDNLSYDLCETQSQGDEWLFLAYLGTVLPKDLYEFLVDYRFCNDALTIMMSLAVDRFEQLAYKGATNAKWEEIIGVGKFDPLFREACRIVSGDYEKMASYVGYPPEQYWRMVVIENPGYYVSYAISLIPSIEIYAHAVKDFDKAAEMYEKLQRTEGDFREVLKKAGLESPFDKAAYTLISEAFR